MKVNMCYHCAGSGWAGNSLSVLGDQRVCSHCGGSGGFPASEPLWDMHEAAKPKNKYTRHVKGADIDVYDVLRAWDVTCPAIQHAVKKLLAPGQRGHKDRITDLREALASVQRSIEMEEGL